MPTTTPPAKAEKALTLADLTPEAKLELLEEAREESKRNPRDVDGYDDLTNREKVVRDLMDARDHSRGCPVQEGTDVGRVEGYDARRPADPTSGAPARDVAVIRCIECGGNTVHDEPLEPLVTAKAEELELKLDDPAARSRRRTTR